jgi:hypothetical protein
VVEVRVSGAAADSVELTPLALTGVASKHGPSPDRMKRSSIDPLFYTGKVWMMQAGSMQVRFDVDGAAGKGEAAVPVAAIALSTLKMERVFGASLAIAGIILILGLGGITAAAVREGKLQPGAPVTPSLRRRGIVVGASTVLFCFVLVWGGDKWWNVEAAKFTNAIYKPLSVSTQLEGDHLRMLVGAHSSATPDQSLTSSSIMDSPCTSTWCASRSLTWSTTFIPFLRAPASLTLLCPPCRPAGTGYTETLCTRTAFRRRW